MKCTYGTINRGLCDEKFVKLEKQPKIEEIFHMIKEKKCLSHIVKKIQPLNEQKLKLKTTNYLAKMDICFRKAIIKSKNVYFINTHLDKAKNTK